MLECSRVSVFRRPRKHQIIIKSTEGQFALNIMMQRLAIFNFLLLTVAWRSTHVTAFSCCPQHLLTRTLAGKSLDRSWTQKESSGRHSTAISAVRQASATTLAGKLWPGTQKLLMAPTKSKAIIESVLAITQWQDLALIGLVSYGIYPLVRLTLREDDTREIDDTTRGHIAKVASDVSKIAFSVYALDVVMVTLRAIGFKFVEKTDIVGAYAKVIYITYGIRRALEIKKMALCRAFKLRDPENMGRIGIIDRVIDGLIVVVASLLLFDWLSVKMNLAMRGVFAFGSVGTLAFTLASQGLLTQLLSGTFLFLSNKFYVGDYVDFEDGTKGTVASMGWMDTTLRNPDNTMTRVPNSQLTSKKITNFSRVSMCQVKQTLRFHYDDVEKIPALCEDIKEELKKSCPKLISNGKRPFRVYWSGFNEDHLEVVVDTHHNCPPM